jgi:secondary thiamine-phosphate synthase enzyme
MWIQHELTLAARRRGLHLVTAEVVAGVPELRAVGAGLLHVFLQHTSAGLTLTENASPEVRTDLDGWLDDVAPESRRWEHSLEGPDDMPAHAKAALLGSSLTLPVADGRLALGTWQGICLAEHRDHGGPRTLVLTLHGE